MELRLPLEMSPGREAACRAVFGTWGFFRPMHGKTAPSCRLHSQGGVRRGVRASGSYPEGTGKSGSYGMWNPPRGHVWNVFVRPASGLVGSVWLILMVRGSIELYISQKVANRIVEIIKKQSFAMSRSPKLMLHPLPLPVLLVISSLSSCFAWLSPGLRHQCHSSVSQVAWGVNSSSSLCGPNPSNPAFFASSPPTCSPTHSSVW